MNHLKDEEIISYYNHKLEQNEEINLLNQFVKSRVTVLGMCRKICKSFSC